MSETYDDAHRKYEQSEKGKERQRQYRRKKWAEDEEYREKDKARDRREYKREYMREFMRQKRAKAKEQRDSQGS